VTSACLPGTGTERALLAGGCATVAGIDEVGRGAWAGPVSVGVAVVTLGTLSCLPEGVRDSKLLTERAREALFAPLAAALTAYAVGHASAQECDALGLTAAQRLAADRALDSLGQVPAALIVDGRYDYTGRGALPLVGADRRSLVVAAASVLAKVTRDRLMAAAAERHPGYGFERNKGYPSAEHRRAVARLGLTSLHRRTWSVGVTGRSLLEADQDGGARPSDRRAAPIVSEAGAV
jgi:ribonuclease HII